MQCTKCSSKFKNVSLSDGKICPINITCLGCGVRIFSKIGGYYECTGCEVYLCCNCKLCPEGHFLSRVLFLNEKGEELYAVNKYNCDSCLTSKKNEGKGVWHCNECEYDICDFCVAEKMI